MPKEFKGDVNLDIRDSIPTGIAVRAPEAPDGAPTSSTSS